MAERNETHQFLETFGFVCGCIVVPVAVLGVVLNCLSVYVFTRTSMRSSYMHILLIGLSVANCIYIVCDTPLFAAIAFYSQENEILDKLTVLMMIYLYPVAMMAQTASIWCLVVVSAVRFFKRFIKDYNRVTWSYKLLIGIVVGSVMYNFCRFWEYTEDETKKYLRAGVLQQNSDYASYYMRWAYFICMFLIPFSIILVSDVVITIALCRRRHSLERSVGDGDAVLYGPQRNLIIAGNNAVNRRIEEEAKNSFAIAVLGFVFIFYNSLAFAINALEIGHRSETCAPQYPQQQQQLTEVEMEEATEVGFDSDLDQPAASDYELHYTDRGMKFTDDCIKLSVRFLISVDVSNVLVQLNCVTNFFVHLIFNRKFRSTLCRQVFAGHGINDAIDDEFYNSHQRQQEGEMQLLVYQEQQLQYQAISCQDDDERSLSE